MRNIIATKETEYIKLDLLDNGILVAYYKACRLLTLDMARSIVRSRLEFVGMDPRPVMVYNRGVVQIEKAARRHVGSGDGVKGIKAAATIADNWTTYMIMGLIYLVEKPPMPAKTYMDADRAMAWLETFL
jgi:hypothetical protein